MNTSNVFNFCNGFGSKNWTLLWENSDLASGFDGSESIHIPTLPEYKLILLTVTASSLTDVDNIILVPGLPVQYIYENEEYAYYRVVTFSSDGQYINIANTHLVDGVDEGDPTFSVPYRIYGIY